MDNKAVPQDCTAVQWPSISLPIDDAKVITICMMKKSSLTNERIIPRCFKPFFSKRD